MSRCCAGRCRSRCRNRCVSVLRCSIRLDGLLREELDAYRAHQLKAAGVAQPLLDETARQALYQATKGILRKVNDLVMTALRLAATRKASTVDEAILLDATSEPLP